MTYALRMRCSCFIFVFASQKENPKEGVLLVLHHKVFFARGLLVKNTFSNLPSFFLLFLHGFPDFFLRSFFIASIYLCFGGVSRGIVRELRGTYVREAEHGERAERRAEKRNVREIYIFIWCESVSGKSGRADFWLADWVNGCPPFYNFVKSNVTILWDLYHYIYTLYIQGHKAPCM